MLNRKGAIIPPTAENDLKVTCDISFVNTTEVSGQLSMSVPPTDPEFTENVLLEEMRSELRRVCVGILGEKAGRNGFRDCHICWWVFHPSIPSSGHSHLAQGRNNTFARFLNISSPPLRESVFSSWGFISRMEIPTYIG